VGGAVSLDSVDFVLVGKTRVGCLVLRRRLALAEVLKCQCPRVHDYARFRV
jgi:hypothetical protein